LNNGLSLEIDGGYFAEKYIEDIFFIDTSIKHVYESLKQNRYLIRRIDYLRSIYRTEQAYTEFLEVLCEQNSPLKDRLRNTRSTIKQLLQEYEQHMEDIEGLLEAGGETEDDEDLVSQEEFRHLLKEENEGSPDDE
jgi:hypothetical protein